MPNTEQKETPTKSRGRGRPPGSKNKKKTATTVKKKTTRKKATTRKPAAKKPAVQTKPSVQLPTEYYENRYFINTNKGGTVFLPDIQRADGHGLGKRIDFDETNGKAVYKISRDQCAKSSALAHHLSVRNLKEVTSQYLSFLESGKSMQESFDPTKDYGAHSSEHVASSSSKNQPNTNTEGKQAYVHLPQRILDDPEFKMKDHGQYLGMNDPDTLVNAPKSGFEGQQRPNPQGDGPLPTLEELSKIEGASDEIVHKASMKETSREGAETSDVETILSDEDRGTGEAGIVDTSIADRSNPDVDPRMYMKTSKKRPSGPKQVKMRPPDDPFSAHDVDNVIGEESGSDVEAVRNTTPADRKSEPQKSSIASELLEE